MLLEKIKDTLSHKEDLINKLKKIRESSEQVLSSFEEKNGNKKKRHRRSAQEVDRHFHCPILKCDKSYGSEGSLNQHIKQKHSKYWNKYCVGKTAKDNICEKDGFNVGGDEFLADGLGDMVIEDEGCSGDDDSEK